LLLEFLVFVSNEDHFCVFARPLNVLTDGKIDIIKKVNPLLFEKESVTYRSLCRSSTSLEYRQADEKGNKDVTHPGAKARGGD
jgi:hypothetical protein